MPASFSESWPHSSGSRKSRYNKNAVLRSTTPARPSHIADFGFPEKIQCQPLRYKRKKREIFFCFLDSLWVHFLLRILQNCMFCRYYAYMPEIYETGRAGRRKFRHVLLKYLQKHGGLEYNKDHSGGLTMLLLISFAVNILDIANWKDLSKDSITNLAQSLRIYVLLKYLQKHGGLEYNKDHSGGYNRHEEG